MTHKIIVVQTRPVGPLEPVAPGLPTLPGIQTRF